MEKNEYFSKIQENQLNRIFKFEEKDT